ncbi:methyl-CpG-binding domain protein 6 isoform X1 [Hypomesus transpacificus]|uniref:methyl-CpG-binding domain protein 6 isoform X1 n=1 Tax=Hypomesus transpacificus TaxID=137520 RepID=UPI001F075B1B|nr:methyl-CpG-binding domain protein 6 isoform X1 [Hypomesus transpacificus]XP_046896131.1 methyl-CpG-binding domain protein 6 isoform X1 [Hypomesus transpacificus]
MMGGSESGNGDKDGLHVLAIHVPIGWQRRVEEGIVVYVSPSGTLLSSMEEVRAYLLTDGTCKCGLECPLVINKVFNFSLDVRVQPHSQPLGKAEQDMTKLCNHRRKVVAMAALCRSMQASQLPFVTHYQEATSGVGENRDPKRIRVDREGEDHGTYPSKHPLLSPRPNNNLNPAPGAGPISSAQLMYSYNGSSPLSHSSTNSHHLLDTLRRLPPPVSLPPPSSTSSSFPGYSTPHRSPRAPTPLNLNQGQRSETPGSPRLGPLSPPPPSSPGTQGAARGGQSLHPQCVVMTSPLSPSPSPAVNLKSASPLQRSRHLSASAALSEQGGAGGGAGGGGYPPRRKSTSSSPLSPGLHYPKHKLEDILEQLKNSGNASTNNHILHLSPLTNQSNPHILSLALERGSRPGKAPGALAGPVLGLGAAGPSGLPMGAFLHHQRQPHPASFPASSLLSAAAKAQLASQMTQSLGQAPGSSAPSLEVSKESQQQQQQALKVTNSTLHNSHHPSITTRPPLPHPAATLPPSQTLMPPSPGERSSHRKRQRRSPTVLSMLRDGQLPPNGPSRPPPSGAGDALNLSSSSCSALHSQPSSTSVLSNSASSRPMESLLHQPPRLPARLPTPLNSLMGLQRQPEALDFTTAMAGIPDPPTQPLSALLHLLSVQNAQAQSQAAGGGSSVRQSPRRSPSSPSTVRPPSRSTQSPCRPNSAPSPAQPLSPSLRARHAGGGGPQSPLRSPPRTSPLHKLSPSTAPPHSQHYHHHRSPSSSRLSPDKLHHLSPLDSSCHDLSQVSAAADVTGPEGPLPSSNSTTLRPSPSPSPKPLDLSTPVLALLAASSTLPPGEGGPDQTTSPPVSHGTAGSEEPPGGDHQGSTDTRPHGTPGPSSCLSVLGVDSPGPLPLAEAFPFMSQEQLLQLLSSTGGLPSLLDPSLLASLHLGGLWLGAQQGGASTHGADPPPPPDQHLLLPHETQQQHQEQQQHKQQQQLTAPINHSSLFPLLPSLVGAQGELPLSLLALLNPLPPPPASTSSPGQESDLGLGDKPGLHALLMASLLLGQQQAMLPLSGLGQLSLDLQPVQQHTLEGLSLEKGSHLLDPASLPGPGLLEVLQGLLPPPAEGPLQALHSLLLPTTLPPPPATFLPLSPALLTAALGSAELPPSPAPQLPPTQTPQQTPPQVTSLGPAHLSGRPSTPEGVDTLIPLSLQTKDNPLLQQLLPTLLNPTVLGDLSALSSLHSLLSLGAGPLLLPQVQASALGMPLLQTPDGAINLLNNIQLNIAPPSEPEKPIPMQETVSPAPQEGIQAHQPAPEAAPCSTNLPAPVAQRGEGPANGGGVLNPYASFMDTIYTSFLQVSAKEQEEAQAPAATSEPALCALPPSTPSAALPPSSGPASLSPRRACSLRNPDLSRLTMEAGAHSPAQGTPKPSDDGCSSPPRSQRAHPDPPLPPSYLEEAKTEAGCVYGEGGPERQGDLPLAGRYLSPKDGCPQEEMGGRQHTQQGRDQSAPAGGARRGRKRKQTLHNVLEDFRDMDPAGLEEAKPTAVLLKPERSVRGRRRRGARSQRQ